MEKLKAIVEQGKVINIIVAGGELSLPEGQIMVDPGDAVVEIGDRYDAASGAFIK